VASALIPFVENDDANRALMGANMQRQAVPLMRARAPLIGTGIEGLAIRDSGVIIRARRDGVVNQVDAGRIVVRPSELSIQGSVVDIYNLDKFRKSNSGTCIHQKPLVSVGQTVKQGDIIADGAATDRGELALGQNVLVAFMPFEGCGFEDSIVLSQKLVDEDAYTSIHIDELETSVRDMKLGYEEITRDVPGVSEEVLRHLDEAGVVYIGAEVAPGDILVGKVSPKAEVPLTPEEKLLRAIFSDKAADMKDSSLRVPAGMSGTVVDVRIFSRRGVERDERSLAIEREAISRMAQEKDVERRILEQGFTQALKGILVGQTLGQKLEKWDSGTLITEEIYNLIPKTRNKKIVLQDKDSMDRIGSLYHQHDAAVDELEQRFKIKLDKMHRGDDLPTGVLKTVKVFLAIKRKIQPGDKLAGRHGNKGVVSVIMPKEDMPYLADGTPVDVVLNPLGLPSRMNVGQILETHLGWVSLQKGKKAAEILRQAALAEESGEKILRDGLKSLYKKPEIGETIDRLSPDALLAMVNDIVDGLPMATPVFEGAKVDEIERLFREVGVNASGQETLYDGRTGEPFDRPVTVGVLYMLKLHHLVDEKIHARSIGPYSLVTQQPLGGKSQFGGQRFGEMEVWALQAYGAARTLLEMLTVKSDDLIGRMEVYKAIIKGQENFSSDVPESFNVLIKELRTLGMNIECRQEAALKAVED
jgi:DNA-directed RNA polymerase subunit beta